MSEKEWQQVRNYPDHLGHRVVLEQFVEPGWTPEPGHLVPIQVYSLVPLDADHQRLREYLMHSFMHEELKPLFEIYSYCPPDAFTCVEHHRREIAYRYTEDWDELAEAGQGPDLRYFNRCFFNTHSHVDEVLRSSDSDGELSPEVFELSTERVMCQTDLGQITMNDVFLNAGRPSLQYALDVDEGEPPGPNLPPQPSP